MFRETAFKNVGAFIGYRCIPLRLQGLNFMLLKRFLVSAVPRVRVLRLKTQDSGGMDRGRTGIVITCVPLPAFTVFLQAYTWVLQIQLLVGFSHLHGRGSVVRVVGYATGNVSQLAWQTI